MRVTPQDASDLIRSTVAHAAYCPASVRLGYSRVEDTNLASNKQTKLESLKYIAMHVSVCAGGPQHQGRVCHNI